MPHSYEARLVSGQLLWLNDTPEMGDTRVVVTFVDDQSASIHPVDEINPVDVDDTDDANMDDPQPDVLSPSVQVNTPPTLRKIQNRHWLQVSGIALDVCEDEQGLFWVRHHVYWELVYRNSNPHPVFNAVLQTLEDTVNGDMFASRWQGFQFQFEAILLEQAGVTLDVLMLPLELFEDLIRWSARHYKDSPAMDAPNVILGYWLQNHNLKDLLMGKCVFPGRRPLPVGAGLSHSHAHFKLSSQELTRFLSFPLDLKDRIC
jgi:hypothetical protein